MDVAESWDPTSKAKNEYQVFFPDSRRFRVAAIFEPLSRTSNIAAVGVTCWVQ
jgi:hypothetical protein